jgi:hypothetical protein
LWSLVLVAVGVSLLISRHCQAGDGATSVPGVDDLPQDLCVDNIEPVHSPSVTR